MSVLDRILGRPPVGVQPIGGARRASPLSEPAPSATPAAAPSGHAAQSADGRMLRGYDQAGQGFAVGREAWRRDVLLPGLAAHRSRPDTLYELIALAAADGFAADVLAAARELADSDPQPRRAAALLGAILLRLADPPAARTLLERVIARHGPDPYLLTVLARAHEAAGDHPKAQELLWQALRLDPNAESTLGWLAALAVERGGGAELLAMYARAAALPASWRAQLWLARHALANGDLPEAMRRYDEMLARAHPPSAELLSQLSGDLADEGRADLLARWIAPRFDPALHGLPVALNLLRAYFDLGQLVDARRLLEKLRQRQRADWREQLEHWGEKLEASERRQREEPAAAVLEMIAIDGPLWAEGQRGFGDLLPVKAASAPVVQFLCASGHGDGDGTPDGVTGASSTLGRLARALPLLLAEEALLRTSARSAFLQPWLPRSGFVFATQPWTRASLNGLTTAADALVLLHIDATQAPWRIHATLDAPKHGPPVTFDAAFGVQSMAHDTLALLLTIIDRLTGMLGLVRAQSPPALAIPLADALPGYLIALERALPCALASRGIVREPASGLERAALEPLWHAAIDAAELLRPRLLLVSVLAQELRRGNDAVRDFLPRVAHLQRQRPLAPGRVADLVAAAESSLLQGAPLL